MASARGSAGSTTGLGGPGRSISPEGALGRVVIVFQKEIFVRRVEPERETPMAHVIELDAPQPDAAESDAARRLRTWSRVFVAVFGIALAVSTTLMVAAVLIILFYRGDQV